MKFSIRDLFWLTLLAACCTLWWLDRGRLDQLQRQEAERQQQANQVTRFLIQSLQSGSGPVVNSSGPTTVAQRALLRLEAGEEVDPEAPPDMLFRPLYFGPPTRDEPVERADETKSNSLRDCGRFGERRNS